MKEVEILVKLHSDIESVLDSLNSNPQIQFVEKANTIDTYYFDPKRDGLKPNKRGELSNSFRVRNKEGKKFYLTYKTDHFDSNGKWIYSDEYESSFAKLDEVQNLIQLLGFKELVIVDCHKYVYENDWATIVAEDVKGLGVFFEVEAKEVPNDDVIAMKTRISTYINSLGFDYDDNFNGGKPELLIQKNQLS